MLLDPQKAPRVLFVLGSGVSSGICPGVEKITAAVLETKIAPSDWNTSILEAADELHAVQGFLRALRAEAVQTIDKPNYEDLYSLCLRLENHELRLRPDPGLTRFRDTVFRSTAQFHRRYLGGCFYGSAPLAAISARSRGFINEPVRRLLRPHRETQGELQLVVKAIRAYGPEHVDILTLNHDLLLEDALTKAEISWTDGFDARLSTDPKALQFDRAAFTEPRRVRVLKIHGGCDWYLCLMAPKRWSPLKLLEGADRWRYTTDYEESQTLTGSTTKGDSYTRGIFGDLNWEARKLLREHDRIVCSGYGWRDEAFNAMLKDWSDEHENRRMLLLHDRAEIKEFEGRNKPWPWPDDWNKDGGSSWVRWQPSWLSETRIEAINEKLFGGK
jgi:hypothetical protein